MLLDNNTVLAGRYKIIKVLGQGGMGAVYLASDKRILKKCWAVKELWDYGDYKTRDLIEKQFKRESAILASLDHPHLPRITDFFTENQKKYLVMDFIEGKTLEDILIEAKKPMTIDFVINITEQIMEVLEYLHKRNPPVIFRDLKPANIMILPEEKIKLIDFGIARIFTAGKKKDTVVMGTPGFAAPEQYGTGQSDARSDIYGLGATLYYCVTGQDPSDNPFQFKEPSQFNPDIPKDLEAIIMKCVNLEPENRFSSIEQLRKAIKGKKGKDTSSLCCEEVKEISIKKIQKEEKIISKIKPAEKEKIKKSSVKDKIKGLLGIFGKSLLKDKKKDQLREIYQEKKVLESDKNKKQIFEIIPSNLDYGVLKKGDNISKTISIKGDAQGVTFEVDRPWLRVYPKKLDDSGKARVTLYTSGLSCGGSYHGSLSLKGEDFEKHLPIKVEIEQKHLNFLSYLVFFFFTIISLIPILGFVGFFYNLIAFFSIPAGERKTVKVFFYISFFTAILWSTIGILWLGINYWGWFKNL